MQSYIAFKGKNYITHFIDGFIVSFFILHIYIFLVYILYSKTFVGVVFPVVTPCQHMLGILVIENCFPLLLLIHVEINS